jgi:Adenylate and Guanylate cyclase catalytic domain
MPVRNPLSASSGYSHSRRDLDHDRGKPRSQSPLIANGPSHDVQLSASFTYRAAFYLDFRRFLFLPSLGDVVGEGSDIYGDGVNIAARLEALAERGGICISAKVHEQARGKITANFEDSGERHLKNMAAPVRTFAVRPGERPNFAASRGHQGRGRPGQP